MSTLAGQAIAFRGSSAFIGVTSRWVVGSNSAPAPPRGVRPQHGHGAALFPFFAGMAEFEREYIREKSLEAQASARDCGPPWRPIPSLRRPGWSLYLEDRPDGVVDLLKLLGGSAAQMLDEATAEWTINLQNERPAGLPNPHGQQRARVGVHDVHRIDRNVSPAIRTLPGVWRGFQ
ncbi:MAG: hypothetical protein JO281_10235 [Pseudonocardiales bacterium]|nr:hypothetical protein [Pseudonocardiales bacterium]